LQRQKKEAKARRIHGGEGRIQATGGEKRSTPQVEKIHGTPRQISRKSQAKAGRPNNACRLKKSNLIVPTGSLVVAVRGDFAELKRTKSWLEDPL